jgi:hypothetical protein
MRPTHLQFRSPKEKTAEYNVPVVTNGGSLLLAEVSQQTHPTFAKSKRFSQYEDNSKITGYRVGPGSYTPNNSSIGRARIKGGTVYRKYHGNKDVSNNGYFFVGHQMTFDNAFVLQSRKSPIKSIQSPMIPPQALLTGTIQRISTASTPARHRRSDSSKPRMLSPNL